MAAVLDLVKHYQRVIEKYPQDEQKVLKAIEKLYKLDVKVQHLQETGVGRTVNALRKEPGDVGPASRALVYKWKVMVAEEESDQEDDHDTTNLNGVEKDSDDNGSLAKTRQDQYEKANSTDKSDLKENKQMNGDLSGSKRKYQSSEEEEPEKKKLKHSSSSENEEYKKKHVQVKSEPPESESQGSDESHSGESDSEMSDFSTEEQKPYHKIKMEPSDDYKCPSKHSSHSYDNVRNESSSSQKSHGSSHKHSKHHSSESRHSCEKSSSTDKNQREKHSKEKDENPEKKHKSDHKSSNKEKSHKEAKSSSKHSSGKHKSSSHKSDSSSEKHKNQSDKSKSEKHSSSSSHKAEKEKHKSSSGKDIANDKHKSKDTSSSKEKSSSSKEKSKDRISSSKEKSSSHKSDKKHSSSNDKSKSSDSKTKVEKNEDNSSSKKSSHKPSSSSSHKSKSSSSKPKEDIPKIMVNANRDSDDDGIDCGSGASFADVLGMIAPTKSKKKTTPTKDAYSPNSSIVNDLSPAALLAPTAKLAPLPVLEISALPEISPNYKPRPPPKFLPHFSDEDAMSAVISSKNQRTKVYSGNKIFGKIPSLYEMCVQILQEHIDALEYTGGVPYEILKPVVDKATPQQLFMLEHHNPYLMEDTDHLWQKHCEKHFRNKKRQELETWREMYLRCQEEQEYRLKSLTANIRMTQEAKKAPIKQTKMAYVDSVVKPPRNIARKQAQHGTAHVASASPAARVAALAKSSNVLKGGVRPPPAAPVSSTSFMKPKKAPLMQKALQFMRGRKR